MKTVTIPLNVAETISLMIPRAALLKAQATAHALVFMEAIETANLLEGLDRLAEPEDDGLGDRATR